MTILSFIEQMIDRSIARIPYSKPSANHLNQVNIIAHRGAHQNNIQENTLMAFEHAWQLGCDGIELDIHATKDEVIVVNHDPTLLRLWGIPLKIKDSTYLNLKQACPHLPQLEQVVKQYGQRMHLFIEIKSPFHAFASLKATLSTLSPVIDYHLIILDDTLLKPILEYWPKTALILVAEHKNTALFCQKSINIGLGGTFGHYLLMRKKYVKQLKSAQQIAGVGFIDSIHSLYREVNRGVFLLFTDKAAKITPFLNRQQRPPSIGHSALLNTTE